MSDYPYPALPRHSVSALGIDTSYYVAGEPDGRPVVLLHGMSTSADSFRETMHDLARWHWLIAPDIPGFGYSEQTEPFTMPHLIEWLAAFRARLALPPMALLGHSFGGILAPAFALSYAKDVTRLLLVAPAILTHQNYPELLKKVGISLGLVDLGSAVSQTKLMVQRQIRVAFHEPDKLHESVWQRRLRDYEQARASADVLKATAFYDLRSHLGEINHPTCLVWGREDPVVPVSDADKLERLIPNTQVHKLGKCGHVPMLEQRAQFRGIAHRFLEGDDVRRAQHSE